MPYTIYYMTEMGEMMPLEILLRHLHARGQEIFVALFDKGTKKTKACASMRAHTHTHELCKPDNKRKQDDDIL